MNSAKLNEVELEYEVCGSGEPVLLISTGPIADSFRPLLSEPALVERYRLISYHQRGQVGSTRSPAPVSFAQHAADAAALLGHLGVRRAHIAGHSTGGDIALQLALERPDLVQSLVLLEPALIAVACAATFFEKAGPALAAYGSGDREAAMAGFLSAVGSLDWETCRAVLEKHAPGSVAQAMKDADTFFGSYLPSLGAWQFGPNEAAAISQPVLSVLGTHTEPLFTEGRSLLHTWFPQAEDLTVDRVGHLLHLQRPEPVARGVAAFLGRHPMTGAKVKLLDREIVNGELMD
jgi:pimeloyl-ACP methyl ester carboxylesterase